MIVCSCNVLTDAQVIDTLGSEGPAGPRTPGQAYRCLGCDPCCGRCLPLINRILREARGLDAVPVGCDTCPGATAEPSDGTMGTLMAITPAPPAGDSARESTRDGALAGPVNG